MNRKLLKEVLGVVVTAFCVCFFVATLANGFPSLYFDRFGGYIPSTMTEPVFVAVAVSLTWYLHGNKTAKKSGWTPVIAALLTVFIYCFLLFSQFYFVTAVVITVLAAVGAVCLYFYLSGMRKKENRTVKFKRYCREVTAFLTAAALCAVLAVPSVIGYCKEYMGKDEMKKLSEVNSEKAANGQLQTEDYDEFILKSSLAEWKELTRDEKADILYKIGVAEAKNLGIDDYMSISFSAVKMPLPRLAYYDNNDRTVALNKAHIDNGTAEENVNSLLHEIFHAYQHYLVEKLDFDNELVKNGYYFEQARRWKDNITNYRPSAVYGYDEYYSQALEEDARAYAESRLPDFFPDKTDKSGSEAATAETKG